MSDDRTHKVSIEIAEIFDSKDPEWITAISMIIDVLYEQFIRECQERTNNASMLDKMMVVGGAKHVEGHRRRLERAA
jgi:hypothetical protein